MLVVALSLPAAAYQVNWTDCFDSYTAGNLSGQGGWATVTGHAAVNVVTDQFFTAPNSVKQTAGSLKSAANRDLRYAGIPYQVGSLKARVYDPMVAGAGDTRVGAHSSAGADITGKLFTANITGAGAGSNTYWRAQWSFGVGDIDGNPATVFPGGTGWTWTEIKAAPRVAGWNYAAISWAFDYTANTAHIEWRINSPTPCLTLDFSSATGRWANSHDVAGVYIGSAYGASSMGNVDNIEFHGNLIPEPTSLLALGTGLIGLAGLIRRKR